MTSRREFLKAAGVAPALLLAAQCSREGMAAAAEGGKLPQIAFGKHRISRLVCGANPFNGGSHLSDFVNREMRSYYTPEQILKTLRRCEEVGITCWQSGMGNHELYRRYVAEGGTMHFIAIESNPKHITALARAGTIGIAHHGETTDQLFKSGQIDKVADFLKRVKDAGLMAGVSTHMPAVVDTIESKGWDPDYYMTCVYQRHRTGRSCKSCWARPRFRSVKCISRRIRRGCTRRSSTPIGPAWRSRSWPPGVSRTTANGSKRRSSRPFNRSSLVTA